MAYYDVVIIGGGIHGVGVAQAAAAAGFSVCCWKKMSWLLAVRLIKMILANRVTRFCIKAITELLMYMAVN